MLLGGGMKLKGKTLRAFISVQSSRSVVSDFDTPWTTAHQASLAITNSRSLLKFMSTESVMPSNHLILCLPLLLPPSVFPSIGVFSNNQLFASGVQSIGVSDSASVLPMNIQNWFPLGWTGWISLTLKSLLQHHSSKASIIRLTPKYQRKRRVASFKI